MFREFNLHIIKMILFKKKGAAFKFWSVIFIMTVMSFFYMIGEAIITRNVERFISFTVFITVYYIVAFVVYLSFEIPDKKIYKGIIELCEHIAGFFDEEFYHFDDYYSMNKVPKLKKKVAIDSLPSKEMLILWRYRLKERKSTYTYMLPFIAALLFADFSNVLDIIINFVLTLNVDIAESYNSFMSSLLVVPIRIILNIFKYGFIANIYIDKLVLISKRIHQVDVLISLENV